jgi:hypothetical protein
MPLSIQRAYTPGPIAVANSRYSMLYYGLENQGQRGRA